MIVQQLNKVIYRPQDRPIVFDLIFEDTVKSAPLIVFCHGYKGYKDWGHGVYWRKPLLLRGLHF